MQIFEGLMPGACHLRGDGVGRVEEPGHVLGDLGLAPLRGHPSNLQCKELRQRGLGSRYYVDIV